MALLIAAALLLAGAVLALVPSKNEHRAAISVATQALATLLVESIAIPVLMNGTPVEGTIAWSYPAELIAARLDPLGAFFLSWSIPMTLLGTIYAIGYLRLDFASRNAGVQFALLNVTSLSLLMIYTMASATVFLLGWEIAAVAAWLLVIWDNRNQKVRFAGFNYLVSTHVGFFVLVAAFMIMHSRTGSMDFASFAVFLERSEWRDVTFVLLMVAFGLKAAFFPFHTWLPRAHSAAPAHVSALMSGVIHKAGLYGILRFTLMLGEPEPWMGWVILFASTLSAAAGVLYTTAQRDLKRMLGYSSTENVGIAGIGFGLGYLGLAWHDPGLAALGFAGGILHIVNHAFFKCLLFYGAGAVYRSTHVIDIERLGGIGRAMPWTANLFLLGGLASASLPPLNGFVSEFLLYAGLLRRGAAGGHEGVAFVLISALLAMVGGLSLLAFARVYGVAFLGTPRDPKVRAQSEAPSSMLAVMAVHAAGMIFLGASPSLALRYIERPLGQLTRHAGGASAHAIAGIFDPLIVASSLFALIVVVLVAARAWLARGAPAPDHVTWSCGYTAMSPRMQSTGASFSSAVVELFKAVLVHVRREVRPRGPFPEAGSHMNAHCVDAVERRIFEVLGRGEALTRRTLEKLPEDSSVSFALGLVVLIVAVGLAVSGGGCL